MPEIEFLFIGWVYGMKNGVNSDKVWTAFKVGNSFYAGWGARGKGMNFKKHVSKNELEKLIRKKKQDYDEVDKFRLFAIFPFFKENVSEYLTYKIMANKVM